MFCIKKCGDLARLNRSFQIIYNQNKYFIMANISKPVENSIKNKINTNLNPVHLDIINESYMHKVPKGSETHFKVIVVSDKFDNVSLVQRHRMINELLKEELENGVHALSIVARTPAQWSADSEVNPSPKCMGAKK